MSHTLSASQRTAIFAVFNDADNSSASFADRLLTLGVGDKATARPLAMEWASKKYNAPIEPGQRGDKLPRNSPAEKAMQRVLAACFPAADMPEPKEPKTSGKEVSPAEKLLAAYLKLDAGQKRSFKAMLAKQQ